MNRRITSIDIVRGLVMVIMALDHTRDLLHVSSTSISPTNLAAATPALFLSRWITHLCAPTFVFLSGVSVYLSLQRSGPTAGFKSFLRKRGLWLIIAEVIFINFAIWFDVKFRIFVLMVICAIGAGMIVLSFLLKASRKMIGIIALAIIFLYNLILMIPFPANPVAAVFTNIFFIPGFVWNAPNFQVLVSYPLAPWIALMMAGFALGSVFEKNETQRNPILFRIGIAAVALSILLRFINIYGDTSPWQHMPSGLYTFLSFMNVSKTPPSLQFLLMFAGLALIFLSFADKLPEKIKEILLVYGKVPLFYYLVHFYVIRLVTLIMVFAQGFRWKDLLFEPFRYGRPETGSGLALRYVWIAWIGVIIVMYPLCKWYGNYKATHPEKKLLKYL